MKNLILLLSICFVCLSSCKKDDPVDQLATDRMLIQEYIANNNLDAQESQDGIFYVIEREGTGEQPSTMSEVEVDYEGFLLDGSKFDSSYDRGERFKTFLFNVIPGWQFGIPLTREGGKIKLIIPSHLGYGTTGAGEIPPNAVLVFNVELYTVFN